MQLRRGNVLTPIKGGVPGQTTYRRCQFDECYRAVSANGLCIAHYQQQIAGKPLSPLRKRRSNGAFREMVNRGVVECLGCGEDKPISEYSPVNRAGDPRPYCKACNAELVRLSNYNVTREFIDLLLSFQDGRCAICWTIAAGGKAMHIDHDQACCPGRRSCGECVRALVCSNCNAYGLAWYEALSPELRTFDLLNSYIAEPPARRLRMELAALSHE